MIISRKKYEKLNDDLIDAKAKVDNAKKELDDENKIMRATLLIKEQRDQFKAENEKLKAERDTLIDDLPWYKAKVSRLEENNEKLNEVFNYQENKKKEYRETIEKLVDENTRLQNELYTVGLNQDEADDKIKKLERENEKYDKQFTDYIDETNVSLNLLSEISQHIGNKPSSSTYKYFRAKLDGIGIKEGER